MLSPFELFITFRYLRVGHREMFGSLSNRLSILGITIGVMALIAVIAVMTGAEADLKDRISRYAAHVIVMKDGEYMENYEREKEGIAAVDGVTEAAPFIYSRIFMRSSNGVTGGILKGVAPEAEARVLIPSATIPKDQNLKDQKQAGENKAVDDINPDAAGEKKIPGLYLGTDTAKKLKVKKGDTLYVMRPEMKVSSFNRMPEIKRCIVSGVIDTPMSDFEISFAYARLKDAQEILGIGDKVTGIELRLKDIDDAGRVTDELVNGLSRHAYWINNWMRMNRNLFSALKLQKAVMFIILFLIVFVAAFNISSSLIMTVIEKTGDISILRAMGAKKRTIAGIFVLKGVASGIVGTSAGTALGMVLCEILKRYRFVDLPRDVYFFSRLPVKLETGDVLLIVSGALFVCFLAALYPARKAVRLNPAETLRSS